MDRARLSNDLRLIRERRANVLALARRADVAGDAESGISLTHMADQLEAEAQRLEAELAILDLWP